MRPCDHRIPASFGAYLRSLRMENGLTLREMAEKIGLSNGYVSLIETGERRPKATVELAKRIAYGLNTSMDEVCTAMGMQRAHPLLERAVELLREGEAEIASGRAKMAEAEEMLRRVCDLMSTPGCGSKNA